MRVVEVELDPSRDDSHLLWIAIPDNFDIVPVRDDITIKATPYNKDTPGVDFIIE